MARLSFGTLLGTGATAFVIGTGMNSGAFAQSVSLDQFLDARCADISDPPDAGVLADREKSERMSDLHWRAVETLADKAFGDLLTDERRMPTAEQIREANGLLVQMGRSIAALSDTEAAIAQQSGAELSPSDASRSHPLAHASKILSRVKQLASKYRENRIAEAYLQSAAYKFEACLVDMQNDIIRSNLDDIEDELFGASTSRKASVLEDYAPISESFRAPGITPSTQITYVFNEAIPTYKGISDSAYSSKVTNWETMRRNVERGQIPTPKNMPPPVIAGNTSKPPPGKTTTSPPPRVKTTVPPPRTAPPPVSLDTIAGNFGAGVKAGNKSKIYGTLTSNVIMNDPEKGIIKGKDAVASRLAQIGSVAVVTVGSVSKESSGRYYIPVKSPRGNGRLVLFVTQSGVSKVDTVRS